MSTVNRVSVSNTAPAGTTPNYPPLKSTSGSSSGGFSYYGSFVQSGCYVIVLTSTSTRNNGSVDRSNDGGIFDSGSVGRYCCLYTTETSPNNIVVRARTTADGNGNGTTFIAGTGGGLDL